MFAFRLAALAGALCLSLMMSGCSYGRVHILIPDFVANGVDGVRLFRMVDGGLQAAGRVAFRKLTTTTSGLVMEYVQIVPGYSEPFGPLQAIAKRPRTGQLELELSLLSGGQAGRFRFATYNENGRSPIADGEVYLP